MVKLICHFGYIINVLMRYRDVDIDQDANIVVFGIPWHFIFSKIMFSLERANIECRILLPDILESMNL